MPQGTGRRVGFLACHDLLADEPGLRDCLRHGTQRLGDTDYDWRLNRGAATDGASAR